MDISLLCVYFQNVSSDNLLLLQNIRIGKMDICLDSSWFSLVQIEEDPIRIPGFLLNSLLIIYTYKVCLCKTYIYITNIDIICNLKGYTFKKFCLSLIWSIYASRRLSPFYFLKFNNIFTPVDFFEPTINIRSSNSMGSASSWRLFSSVVTAWELDKYK